MQVRINRDIFKWKMTEDEHEVMIYAFADYYIKHSRISPNDPKHSRENVFKKIIFGLNNVTDTTGQCDIDGWNIWRNYGAYEKRRRHM